MKRIRPEDIKIGEYYIQEFDSGRKLLKIRVETEDIEDINRIRGRVIKVIGKQSFTFKEGNFGFLYYNQCKDVKFYLLTKEEMYLYLLD